MVNKPFGAFLLEQKLLDEDTLLGTLLEQSKNVSSPVEMLYKARLLTANQLLQVFEHQQQYSLDFRESCKFLRMWRPEFEEYIHTEISKIQKNFVQILIENKRLSQSDLINAVDKYLNTKSQPPAEVMSGSNTEFEQVDELGRFELSAYLSNSLKEDMKKLLLSPSIEKLTQLRSSLQTVRGIATFVGATRMESLVYSAENLLDAVTQPKNRKLDVRVTELLNSLLDIIWLLGTNIVQTGSERHHFESLEEKLRFFDLLTQMNGMTVELNKLGSVK